MKVPNPGAAANPGTTATSPAPRARRARLKPPAARGRRGRKLAEIIAERIEDDIIARGWPVGTALGSEADLLKTYGVSRSVLREAIRLLEMHRVVRMRPGPNSGLIVTEPESEALGRAIALHLKYRKVKVTDYIETKRALELTCVRLAAERITPEGVARLRQAVEAERRMTAENARTLSPNNIHILLAELTGNPAMHLFVEVLTRLTLDHSWHLRLTPQLIAAAVEAHAKVAEAVIAGDVALAVHHMRYHLGDLEESLC